MMDEALHGLLSQAVREGASDLHVAAGEPARLRVQGELRLAGLPHASRTMTSAAGAGAGTDADAVSRSAQPCLMPAWSAQTAEATLGSIMTHEQRTLLKSGHDLDFALQVPGLGRFRVNAFHHRHGAAAAIRVVPARSASLAELKAPPALAEWALLPRGLVLCTGATGSGKSCTLAAMVDHRNARRADHILTLEDPIEHLHDSRRSRISQREIGTHASGFAQALRSALREDPDVILIGELRDLETIRLALTAAETGHLVLATLHTAGAAQAPDRLIDVFPGHEREMVRTMLAEALEGVVSQVLCRRADGAARVAAFELLRATPAVRHLIREHKPAQLVSVMQSGLSQGMQTLDQHLAALVREGAVDASEAALHARHPENFR